MKLLNVFWDMDDTIANFKERLDQLYYEKYKIERPDDPTQWKLSKESCDIFKTEGFFASLEPIYSSIYMMGWLFDQGHSVYILTNPMGSGTIAKEKYDWIDRYLSWIRNDNIIMTGRKDLIGDSNSILVDDCPQYLDSWKGITVGVDCPYNQEVATDYRIYNHNFNPLYNIFGDLAFRS